MDPYPGVPVLPLLVPGDYNQETPGVYTRVLSVRSPVTGVCRYRDIIVGISMGI